ncbi:Shy1 protein [Saccharomycopsis crataegensis]|uniref:SURF1-like protein n=1 Tax=Saccharomycopsis crataegensis TaxID=43959 RepID=A0AAV5QF25_9ASCO|nr:Shy1 protein [Saccharomycopsis crataegensis]
MVGARILAQSSRIRLLTAAGYKRSFASFVNTDFKSVRPSNLHSNGILHKQEHPNLLAKRLITNLRVSRDLQDKDTGKSDERFRKIKNGIVLSLLILFPIVCLNLGNWQYKRLHWKTDLIYKLKDRVDSQSVDIQKVVVPTDTDEITQLEDDLEFTKFKIRGKFVHEEELFVGPRVSDEIRGYFVYTPFIITSEGPNKGKKIIVSRGFIGEKKVSPQSRLENNKLAELALPMGEVTIECLLRRRVKPGSMALDNDKNIRLLAYVDIYDIAERTDSIPIYFQQMRDLSDKSLNTSLKHESSPSNDYKPWWKLWGSNATPQPKVEQLGGSGRIHEFTKSQFLRNGVPLGTTGDINIRNNHLEYLITWYSLALVSTVLIYFVVRKKTVNPLQEKLKHAKRLQ